MPDSRASILFRCLVLLVPALVLCGCRGGDGRRASAILITLDTTRADALGCYGGRPGITPALDRMATEGLLYRNARTVAPLTLPAHASMMTGLYPIRHLARDNGTTPLPDSAVTLAELAADRGYETAAFVAASVLDRGLGMAQGFERYSQPARPLRSSVTTQFPERPADEVVEEAKRWLAERDAGKPFLLWVHFFDPHHPYAPPSESLEVAGGNPYLGEIAHMDRAIADLRGALEELGLMDRALVAVVSDHGEGLGEHGEPTHGALCYDSTMRVPLILRYPDGHRAGESSDEIVSVVDLFPTIVEALDLGEPGAVDGRSLYRRTQPPDRGVYFESYYGYLQYGWSPITGWVDARGKYIHGTTPEFYVPANDARETRDLSRDAPGLDAYRAALGAIAELEPLTGGTRVDEELLTDLRALGYVASGAAPRRFPLPMEQTGLPDARTREAELTRLFGAFSMGEQERFDEAIVALQSVVTDNPRNAVALKWLSTYLIHRQRCDEALPILKTLLDQGADNGSTHNNLGHCLLERGDDEKALVHFRRAFELEPTNPILPHNIALALERLGRADEARRFREP